jgi:hypothetical protein
MNKAPTMKQICFVILQSLEVTGCFTMFENEYLVFLTDWCHGWKYWKKTQSFGNQLAIIPTHTKRNEKMTSIWKNREIYVIK